MHKDATLYSVVPLPLDLTYKEEHMNAISTEISDVQLLEKTNLPRSTFQFFNDTIAVLNSHEENNKKKTSITAAPFTSLLLGPTYACHRIMQSYISWAHVDKHIFSINHKRKPQTHHTKETQDHSIAMWNTYSLPKVWACATFSAVEVSCYMPQSLQKELQFFFETSIIVNAHAPYASYEHNECMAWLYAFYAVSAARLVGRTTLCHYQSIDAQYKLWYDNKETTEKIFPKPWALILKKEKKMHRYISSKIKNSNQNSTCAQLVIEKSKYNIKEFLYDKTKIKHTIIGFSHICVPTLGTDFYNTNSTAYKLILRREKDNILLCLPFLPSSRSVEAIKEMIHKISKTRVNSIHIDMYEAKTLNPTSLHSSYAIMGNLLLKALRTIKPNRNTITVTMPASIQNSATEIACVVEYKLTLYSKLISPHKMYLCINAGHIARKTFVEGNIEYIAQEALRSLFGINTSSKKILEIHTTFVQENTLLYTSSIKDALYHAITSATYNALKNHIHRRYFPMICAENHSNS